MPIAGCRSPGKADLRRAVGDQEEERSEVAFDPEAGVVITCGEGDAMMDALFVLADPGDEVILTDPTYVGMINRVRIVSAVPRLVPQHREQGEWRLETDALAAAVTDRTRAIFVANPGMPTGNHQNEEEWEAIASICREPDVRLIYQAWMERIVFDQRPHRHPASLPDMADRVIHRGCVSMEQSASGLRWTSSPEGAGSPASVGCRRRRWNSIACCGAASPLAGRPMISLPLWLSWHRFERQTLEQTFEASLPSGGRITETARQLHLHHQSVRYGAAQIRKFLGETVDSDAGRTKNRGRDRSLARGE